MSLNDEYRAELGISATPDMTDSSFSQMNLDVITLSQKGRRRMG